MTLPKLSSGDTVRIVAPSLSMAIISKEVREIAIERLESIGLKVEFGAHVEEVDNHMSSSVASRVQDLHDAYTDKSIKAIFAVIGGHNANQLLSALDWKLIKENPKPLIGYSDTTALQNAILARTGAISYSGPAFSTFGQKLHFDYTLQSFVDAVMKDAQFGLKPSDSWSDDLWFLDQDKRQLHVNEGWLEVNPGEATGRIVGGNLGTLSLLFGTEYMPDLKDSILFIEDDDCEQFNEFDRLLQSLVHQPGFDEVRGIVLGRFQTASQMNNALILELFKTRKEFKNMPVIANVDFGHTSPMITYPVGGSVRMKAVSGISSIVIS
jgi:muramoyltetrapeptide carboxypeptidase